MEQKINLLLIEDNPADALFAGIQLKKAFGDAHHLQTTDYFLKATQICETKKFDAIILDLSLPDSRGLDTLKKFVSTYNTPIIVYTGMSDKLVIKEAKNSGATDFLIKGETTVELLKQSILKSIEMYNTSNK
ncbi:MAG: response regulator [Bacteroidota bacterium]